MRGWILYHDVPGPGLKPESYEVRRLLEVGEALGMDMRVVNPDELDLIVTKGGRRSILLNSAYPDLPDFLLPRMGSSTTYFALAVIRHLERLGVMVFNSANSIEMVKDKLYTQQMLALTNLPVPRTMLVKFPVDADFVKEQIGFPLVIKTLSGTQGVGVFLSETKGKFIDLMQLVGSLRAGANVLLQEFIADSRGRDLRVFVVGGRAVACMVRRSVDGNFKANISQGGMAEPYAMTPEIEWLAVETARVLDLDIAGVDLLFDGDHFKICEANSAPGFQGLEQYTGLNVAQEILNYIQLRLGAFGGGPAQLPIPTPGEGPVPISAE